MGDIVASLKRIVAEHDTMLFFGGFAVVILSLGLNGIGLGSSHWIEAGSTHCGPFGDDSDTDILAHACGYDNDVVYLIPAGTLVTVIGEIVLYFFFRRGLDNNVLLRIGGGLVLLGGLLVIIGDAVWASDMPLGTGVSLGYSFALSVTGGVFMTLVGLALLSMSVLRNFDSPYSNV